MVASIYWFKHEDGGSCVHGCEVTLWFFNYTSSFHWYSLEIMAILLDVKLNCSFAHIKNILHSSSTAQWYWVLDLNFTREPSGSYKIISIKELFVNSLKLLLRIFCDLKLPHKPHLTLFSYALILLLTIMFTFKCNKEEKWKKISRVVLKKFLNLTSHAAE